MRNIFLLTKFYRKDKCLKTLEINDSFFINEIYPSQIENRRIKDCAKGGMAWQ